MASAEEKSEIVASFVESAPPGELSNVVNDVKSLSASQPSLIQSLTPAFKKYNEQQYTTVKLPGGSEEVVISEYNVLNNGRYFDSASETSFDVDHAAQKASNPESHSLDPQHAALVRSLHTAFSAAASEHFPSSSVGIYPASSGNTIALLLVANKYSPQNFWNGRWRSTYFLDPETISLTGTIKVDVHYYEDGNVRMSTLKKVQTTTLRGIEQVAKEIAKLENRFQEELNRSFTALAEGSFKGLRRQLPVTRQRVEWEKIGSYRLGQDIGGGRSR